jgi:Flp pilus assembly protein TadG
MNARRPRRRSGGQALVEFSLVLIPFMWLLLGVVDLGRGIYTYNGVAQAAREIARADSVHACDVDPTNCTVGTSSQTTAVVATQKGLVPGLGGAGASITFACTDASDTVVAGVCGGDPNKDYYVRVTVSVPFSVVTPLLSMVAPRTITSVSHIQIP